MTKGIKCRGSIRNVERMTKKVSCVSSSSGGGGNFILSSSLVGYTTVLGGVAPMVHHGYGFFYRIRDDR